MSLDRKPFLRYLWNSETKGNYIVGALFLLLGSTGLSMTQENPQINTEKLISIGLTTFGILNFAYAEAKKRILRHTEKQKYSQL